MNDKEKIQKSLDIVYSYGQMDGAHHKAWVIDQITRTLCGDDYENFVHNYEYLNENGEETEEPIYTWDTGIVP